MKQNLGLGVTAVALAAMIGISTQRGRKPDEETNARPAVTQVEHRKVGNTNEQFANGPCVEIEKRLQDFLLGGDRTALAAPRSCYDSQSLPQDDKTHGEKLRNAARGLQFVIATLPDPMYTHFSLSFDRMTEAIQEGASDGGYVYDSSWLPWDTEEAPYALMSDQDKAEDRRTHQEEQPGILLFRRRMRDRPGDSFLETQNLFDGGLVILVVGEEPTHGIHRAQFKNATEWIAALQPRKDKSVPDAMLPNGGILGPSSSGSLPSLATLLQDPALVKQWQPGNAPLLIYSGTISVKGGVDWFNNIVVKKTPISVGNPVRIASFELSDDDLLDAYCHYLTGEGSHLENLAILSEDETAYGQDRSTCLVNRDKDPKHADPAGLVRLYYPRGIAAMRTAYQKESVFSTEEPSSSSTERRTLSSNFADSEGQQHDTIREYNHAQLPQSQEGVLQQIVSQLRAHHSEYIVLRSSNPLDQLFLAHYLQMTYPHGRIVILGADALLRRETGAARLNGIMTLTTYPLLPWEPHWTWTPKSPDEKTDHSHRVFPQDRAEGLYVATRFLLNAASETEDHKLNISGFAPADPANALQIPDYGPPTWLKSQKTDTSADPANNGRRPTGWLSVLGRDDFWPVAALQINQSDSSKQDKSSSTPNNDSEGDAWREYGWLGTAGYSLIKNVLFFWTIQPKDSKKDGTSVLQAPMPLGIRVALSLVLFWTCFHLACCYWYSITSKPSHRSYFVCFDESYYQHRALLVLGSLTLSAAATTLAWGSGIMATREEILPENRWACALVVLVVWVLAGSALAINVWKQSKYFPGKKKLPTIFIYVAGTVVSYYALYWSTERMLSSGSRIPVYWRSMNLTSGVSPIVPFLVLSVGVYLWLWRALEGLALFGPDQPLLPEAQSLKIAGENREELDWLNMFSREDAATPVLELTKTLPSRSFLVFCATLAGQWLLIWLLGVNSAEPIRSLGARSYAQFVCFLITVIVSVMVASAFQLTWLWIRLRRILVHLDRLPLRRTMAAIHGFSWNSVWKLSGNVLELRYKLVSSLLESARRFERSMEGDDADPPAIGQGESKGTKPRLAAAVRENLTNFDSTDDGFAEDELKDTKAQLSVVAEVSPATFDPRIGFAEGKLKDTRPRLSAEVTKSLSAFDSARTGFARWYASGWKQERLHDQTQLKELQESFATLAGRLLSQVLLPAWRNEREELGPSNRTAENNEHAENSHDENGLAPHIRYAEELVCYVYLGFIQNVLGRMRTQVMGIVSLFIAVTISLASYPFDPRTVVNAVMVLLFFVLGMMIVTVYAQMHRDPLLSALTNTKPGELDADFWFKLIGFGAAPVLGLLATIFPEMTNFLFSWIAPGISSIK